jgi:hypothetical protein
LSRQTALPVTPGVILVFQKFEGSLNEGDWQAVDPVLKDPESIYK